MPIRMSEWMKECLGDQISFHSIHHANDMPSRSLQSDSNDQKKSQNSGWGKHEKQQ